MVSVKNHILCKCIDSIFLDLSLFYFLSFHSYIILPRLSPLFLLHQQIYELMIINMNQKNKDVTFHILQYLYKVMEFEEDSISEFIRYKLNNPQALDKEMKLIEDRRECMRKLQESAKQMDGLQTELAAQTTVLETLTSKKSFIQANYQDQIAGIERQIQDCKDKAQFTKKATIQKQSSSQQYIKIFEQFKRQIVIKKQRLIEDHTSELTTLDEQTDKLLIQKQQKKMRKIALENQLKKLKDRQRIIANTKQNVELIRGKWNTKHYQLQQIKQMQRKKEMQIDELIRYSKSMQKVIYNNLYKKCSEVVSEMKSNLNIMYKYQGMEGDSQDMDQHFGLVLVHLKVNRQKMMNYIKEKRQKFKLNSNVPQSQPKGYNFIVETKINPQVLPVIDPDDYVIDSKMYEEMEEGQNKMLDSLEIQKLECLNRQKNLQSEIQGLQKRILQFQDQIDVKKRNILSPPRVKRK